MNSNSAAPAITNVISLTRAFIEDEKDMIWSSEAV